MSSLNLDKGFYVFQRIIKNCPEEDTSNYSEEDYQNKLEDDWFKFWEIQGYDIIKSSFTNKYRNYISEDKLSEDDVNNSDNSSCSNVIEFNGKTDTDYTGVQLNKVLKFNSGQLAAENSGDHIVGDLGSECEISNKILGYNDCTTRDTNSENINDWKSFQHIQRILNDQSECHFKDVSVHGKGNSQENITDPVSTTEEQALFDSTDVTWDDIWHTHSYQVYAELFAVYSDLHYQHHSYFNTNAEANNSSEETDNSTTELHANYIDEITQMQAAGLPTSFKTKKEKRRTKKSQHLISERNENSEMLDSGEVDKPETAKKAKVNRKLRKIPQYIREDVVLLSFWRRRYSLFSRFDQGIKLDRESWYSVTPEKVAKHMAERLRCDVIIDAFCGSGGNTIQFAFKCSKVIAIDIDPEKIENARRNAKIYGVAHKIEFIIGDYLQLCKSLKGDVVFLSPPWGGPRFSRMKRYDIEKFLQPVGAADLLGMSKTITENVVFFFPKNSDRDQIVRLAGNGNRVDIEHNYLQSKLIGLTAVYGDWLIDKCNMIETTGN